MENRRTATYKVTKDAGGNRYSFFCDISGALGCMTGVYSSGSPEKELMLAWENEGKAHFNRCEKCGKWVVDVMYNVDAFRCVDCAPWTEKLRFCPDCGEKASENAEYCSSCGRRLDTGRRRCV